VAALGPDILLGALALGAGQVVVLSAGSEAPEYHGALERELEYSRAILAGLGYTGERLALVETGDVASFERAVWSLDHIEPVAPATFNLLNEKRRTLDAAIEHLARHAPAHADVIP